MFYKNSFREALGKALVDAGNINKNIVVIDTDLSKSTRTKYFQEKFPNRFIQLGISEQDAVGTAAGLAIGGKTPILVSYAMFIMRGWEQIRNTISRDNLNVKIVGTHSGLSDYLDGSSHQCLEDIALMRVLPNFTVIAPSDTTSTYALLMQSLEIIGPVYIRLGRDNASTIYEDEEDIELGKANILHEGSDINIISNGAMLKNSLEVAKLLEKRGIKARVVDMHTVKPIDKNILVKICREGAPIITIEDHNIIGGLGGAVAEEVTKIKPVPVIRLGLDDRFGVGSTSYEKLLEYLELTPEKLIEKIVGVLNGL